MRLWPTTSGSYRGVAVCPEHGVQYRTGGLVGVGESVMAEGLEGVRSDLPAPVAGERAVCPECKASLLLQLESAPNPVRDKVESR